MPDFLPVALIVLAAVTLAVAGILAYRIIWPTREPRQEPVSPAATATPGRLRLLLVRWAQRRAEPGHVGATEEWSPTGEMAAVVAQPSTAPAPDWDADRWELDVHAALNDMEDRFRYDVEHLWNGWYDQLGVDPRTRLRLASSVEQTGEIDRAELEAMLAAAERAEVGA